MAKKSPRLTPVPGSARQPIAGAKVEGPVAGNEIIDVTIRLREGQKAKAEGVYREQSRGAAANAPLTREELAQRVGARAEDARLVEAYAHDHGLTVLAVSLPQRTVQLRGPADAMEKAFGVSLERVAAKGHSFRQRSGSVHVPTALGDVVTGVFGLDDRPQAKPHFRLHTSATGARFEAHATTRAFTPLELAKIYEFPAKANGKGQCIALIELGGGYKTSDLNAFAKSLGLPAPDVVAVSVDGAHNHPTGNPNGPDGEVVLDVEVAAGVAPGAKIAVYFAPNTDRGFLDAVSAAVHDTNKRPNVISISWGGPEASWTRQSMDAMTQIFGEAASIGVPVFVASGDDGATDGVETGELTVDFPAASPAAIACGGTRLEAANGRRTREVVWNDLATESGATGGGFSKIYQAPAWQKTSLKDFKQHMRGVPDVSANADPETGYRIHVDGKSMIFGGTSAVAPLMAGLVALCAQKGGATPRDFMARVYGGGKSASPARLATTRRAVKLPDFASKVTAAQPLMFDVTEGKIDGFSARSGWDACTGLGVPVGARVLKGVYGK